MKSNSLNIRNIGHHDLNGYGNGGQVTVQRRGDEYYAFIGHMEKMGTSIVNVTNPSNPSLVFQIPINPKNLTPIK
jgi:hypothetical protein